MYTCRYIWYSLADKATDHVAVRAVCDVCSVINSCSDVFVCSGIAHSTTCWTGAGVGVKLTAGAKIFCSPQLPDRFCSIASLLSKGLEFCPVVKWPAPEVGYA